MVRMKGLEPSRIAAPDPKSGVSANFTTSAKRLLMPKIGTTQTLKALKAHKMVRPRGLEPLTYGLEGRCSIQLSYGHTWILSKGQYQSG